MVVLRVLILALETRAMPYAEMSDAEWTTLKVILGNSYRSDSPIPEKLRIFDACCVVIDEVIIGAENSRRAMKSMRTSGNNSSMEVKSGRNSLVKAHEMLDVAIRPGRCEDREASGSTAKDDGQTRRYLYNSLPSRFCEDLSYLRDKVPEINAKSGDNNRAKLQALQAKIDVVHNHGPCGARGSGQSNHTQAQASGSSAVVQLRRSSRELIPGYDRPSPASASTAVAPDQYDALSPSDSGIAFFLLSRDSSLISS
ncbi:hypothetical protein BJY52DRAFT_1400140 [Lactarius psammicola]|nr:hypothetical protein BJY52DRAFT_1400140 [Lactarius psammicola]